jgi:hypothetical protein
MVVSLDLQDVAIAVKKFGRVTFGGDGASTILMELSRFDLIQFFIYISVTRLLSITI